MSQAGRIVSRPETSVIAIAVLTFLLCIAQGQVLQTIPQIQDEFSYLLAADTFSAGRLTNPTHPLWRYFETVHVIQQPTYQSKYPPGQGLALALGQTLTGSALVGVWISLSLAAAAVCWMLQAWLPPPWALLGGVLAATNGRLLCFWGGTYMGGAVAMLGGALLFGALARSLEDPRPRHGIVLAVGLLILANSRPFEGLIASLPAAAVLLVWLLRQTEYPRRQVWKRLLVPLAVTLACGVLWMGYYNYRVTGSPFELPYQVYLERHGFDVFGPASIEQQSLAGHPDDPRRVAARLANLARFHFGGAGLFALPLIVTLPWLVKRRWALFGLATSLLTMVVVSRAWGAEPHYVAPISALVIGLMVQSLRIIAGWLPWRAAAVAAVGSFFVVWLYYSSTVIQQQASMVRRQIEWSRTAEPPPEPQLDKRTPSFLAERRTIKTFARRAVLARQEFVDRFERDPDRHLILVRYPPGSIRHREWVYNRASIDEAAAVWALWPKSEPLWPLLARFGDRRFWLVEPERAPWEMRRFPVEEAPTWHIRRHSDARAGLLPSALAEDPVKVEIRREGSRHWHLQLERAHPPVYKGRMYFGAFWARAEAPRSVLVEVGQARQPWRNMGLRRRLDLGPRWKRFSYGFRATDDEPIPRFVFGVGLSDAAVEISGVELSSGSTEASAQDVAP